MAYDEKYRARAVAFKDAGHSFAELHEAFQIYSSTYYRWKRLKEASGVYAPKSAEKLTRKRKNDSEKLRAYVEENQDTFLYEIAKVFNCSAPAIYKRLKAMNITLKKTFTYSEKSESARAAYLEKIEKIPEEKRVYVDESGVEKHLVRERARALRGVKVEDVKRGRKYQRVNVVAAQFRDATGRVHRVAPFCYTQPANSELFEDWFRKILVKSLARGSTIILDNASFHRPERLKNLARRHGVRILFLPAYSPD